MLRWDDSTARQYRKKHSIQEVARKDIVQCCLAVSNLESARSCITDKNTMYH